MAKKTIAELEKEIAEAKKEKKRRELEKKLEKLKPSKSKAVGRKIKRRLGFMADNIVKQYG